MQSLEARSTGPVIDDRLHHNSVTLLVVGHALSDLLDNSTKLMTESQRDSLFGDRVWSCWAQIWATEIWGTNSAQFFKA